MKKVFTIMSLVVVAIFMGSHAKAQDVPKSLNGSHYYLIYLDGDTEANYNITPQIVQDLRPDWNGTNNPSGARALYNWTGSGYVMPAATGKGFYGQIGSFLDFSCTTSTWSGAAWCMRTNSATPPAVTASFPIDYTAMTDNYRFHAAFRSTFALSSTVQIYGTKDGAGVATGAKFNVGIGNLDATLTNQTPGFIADGTTWNEIDMSVADLKKLGFSNRGTMVDGNYFVILSGKPMNEIALDAVFFYDPTPSGVSEVKATELSVKVTNKTVEVMNTTAPVEVYSVTGTLVKKSVQPIFGVEELAKGVYVIKSGSAVAKIMIK